MRVELTEADFAVAVPFEVEHFCVGAQAHLPGLHTAAIENIPPRSWNEW